MATVNSVIRRTKVNKEGFCNVQIAVRHGKGCTVYIATDIKCKPENFKDGMLTKKHPNYIVENNKLAELIGVYEERLGGIGSASVYTAQQLKRLLVGTMKKDKALTYSAWSRKKEKECGKDKQATADLRRLARERFELYAGGEVCLCDLTREMVQGFKIWLEQYEKDKKVRAKTLVDNPTGTGKLIRWVDKTVKVKAWSAGTVQQTLNIFRSMVNSAIDDQVVKYEVSPVHKMGVKSAGANKADIMAVNMQKLINYVPGEDKGEGRRVAVDFLLMSFYLGGMNLADVMERQWNLDEYSFTFLRKKARDRTAKPVVVELPLFPKAKNIMRKYLDKDGRVQAPILLTTMNHLLKKVAKECGIDERLCLNSARKSFTQYATNLGCDMMVTNYIVGHSGSLPREMKVMEYYAKGNMELAFLTMKKVFDYVDDPSKYDSDLHAMMMRELTE